MSQDAFSIFTGISVTVQRESFLHKTRSVMESILTFPGMVKNSHYELVLCKRTNDPNHTLKHTGNHFRVRLK